MRAGLAVLALTAGLAGPAAAAPWSADDLREACRDGDAYYIYGACAGYLMAVHDQQLARFGTAAGVCLPEDESFFALGERGGEAVVGLDVIEDESGPDLALRALGTVYPCE